MALSLPWENDADIEIANNELINQFTINRSLRRLLDNDESFTALLDASSAFDIATDAQAVTGTATNLAITPKQLLGTDATESERWASATDNTQNFKKAENGWQEFPSGLIMQWGIFPDAIYNTTNTVSFNKAFTTICFFGSAVNQDIYITSQSNGMFEVVDKTSFKFLNPGTNTTDFRWFAIGY